MPTSASTRLGLIGPSATDLISQGDDIIRAIIAELEAYGAGFLQGTIGARNAAGAGNAGFIYYATDTGVLSYSTGSAWVDINPKDAAAGTASLRTLGSGAQQAMAGNEPRVLSKAALKTRYTGTADTGSGDIYSLTGTFRGGAVLVTHFGGEAANNFTITTENNQYQILLDGSVQETINNGTLGNGTKARLRDVSLLLTAVSAGSHTISVRNGISDGTGAYTTVGNSYPILFAAVEI
jgi:hypothetical protein